jgi:hypothetical protein
MSTCMVSLMSGFVACHSKYRILTSDVSLVVTEYNFAWILYYEKSKTKAVYIN